MTQTNTDYLLQITAPVPDRSYGVPAASGAGGNFDDHLTQATTFSGDDSSNRGSSQRTEGPRHDRDDRSWNASSSKPSNHDTANSTSPRSAATDQERCADEVSESKRPADDVDDDKHDTDDTTGADVAAAGQAASSNTTKNDSKPKPTKNSDASATAKAAVVGKKAITGDGKRDASKADRQATSEASSTDTKRQYPDVAAQLAVDATDDPNALNEEENESQETVSEGKRPKVEKIDVVAAKSKQAAGTNNNRDECHDSTDVTGIEKVSTEAAQKATASVEVSATPADASTAKAKLKADDSSDEDTRPGSPGDTQPGARNDTSVTTGKVDAAQLVGGIPAPSDTGANLPQKGKDNEQATKPVGAKSEPVGATFARMTRNNIAGSNESAAGPNDLPQVDPSRFIGRVAKAFQTAQDRGGTLQLRLSPPELGALRIELNVKDGVMSASLQTENANARRLLLDHLPALRDRLAEQNIRVDRFDVDVRQEGSGGRAGTHGSQQQQFQHQFDQPAPRRQVQSQLRTEEIMKPERVGLAPNISDAGLNLIV